MPKGVCRLCWEERDLTFEHVPPGSAFNRSRVQVQVPTIVDGEGLVAEPGPYQQRGAGGYYLCGDCNSFLGREYVPAYLRFVAVIGDGMNRVEGWEDLDDVDDLEATPTFRLRVERLDEGGLEIRPNRVAKQAVAMMICSATTEFGAGRADLRDWVRDLDARGLPGGTDLGVSFYLGQQARFGGPFGQADIATREIRLFIEVAFPPLAWMLTLDGTGLPEGFANVEAWADYDRDAVLTGFDLEAQVGFGTTLLPGDYRTAGQLRTHLNRNP